MHKHISLHTDLIISQPSQGYRFTSDAVALAEFIRIAPSESLLDFCTGVGIIPLLVWKRNPYYYAVGVELQKDLADLGVRNVIHNRLSEKITIIHHDLRTLQPETFGLLQGKPGCLRFDVISANPPYLPVGQGRINPNSQKALARHELALTFFQLVHACKQFLKPYGRCYFVHRVTRESQVLTCLKDHGFTVISREYANRKGRKALLLVEAKL